jgi:excisionase family DNA binding protein
MGQKVNLEAAAKHVGMSKRSIERLIESGQLPAYRVADIRAIRVDLDDLEKLLNPIERKQS